MASDYLWLGHEASNHEVIDKVLIESAIFLEGIFPSKMFDLSV